jgi:hypothetical protein
MADKPSSKPFWATTGTKTEPTGSKKATGWLQLEKPPFEFMNWLFFQINEFVNYFSGDVQHNIIIGGDTDERDYATLAAYIADSPTAGDRLLIKADEVLTATAIIPADIEITVLKGVKFTLATNFSPIVQFGNNVAVKGDFRVENSDTGTIAKGFSVNGDNGHFNSLIIDNKSTGIITSGVYIEAGAEGNYAQSRSINSGGGSITGDLVDNSGNNENDVTVRGDAAISRSRGARFFQQADEEFNVIIDTAANGGNYTTLAAYLAASPASGDRVLIKDNQTLTATAVIPERIELTIFKEKVFNVATNFSPIIQFGNHVKVNGLLKITNNDTGTIAKAFSFNGDESHYDNLTVENQSTGTITNAYYIEAGKKANYANGVSYNAGAGAITNVLVDASGVASNDITIRERT